MVKCPRVVRRLLDSKEISLKDLEKHIESVFLYTPVSQRVVRFWIDQGWFTKDLQEKCKEDIQRNLFSKTAKKVDFFIKMGFITEDFARESLKKSLYTTRFMFISQQNLEELIDQGFMAKDLVRELLLKNLKDHFDLTMINTVMMRDIEIIQRLVDGGWLSRDAVTVACKERLNNIPVVDINNNNTHRNLQDLVKFGFLTEEDIRQYYVNRRNYVNRRMPAVGIGLVGGGLYMSMGKEQEEDQKSEADQKLVDQAMQAATESEMIARAAKEHRLPAEALVVRTHPETGQRVVARIW